MRFVLVFVAAAWFAGTGANQSAHAAGDKTIVDLELVLMADASGSIDHDEILFQRQGYASAITHRDVLAAIGSSYYKRIAITYVEWGDESSQEVVVPWTIIDGAETAKAFAKKLMTRPRLAFGPNAIGEALAFGHALIEQNDIKGPRKVIDFSGDSANNWGGVPIEFARAAALADGIVINGLAILCRTCNGRPIDYDLEAAFHALITGGPGSFVVTADNRPSFAKAVRKKLILEIAAVPALGNPYSVASADPSARDASKVGEP